MTEIPPDVAKRICAHVNEDHAPTVYATVLYSRRSNEAARGSKVQNARMTYLTLQEYSISYVVCDGDACTMKSVTIPFDPPLKSAGEVRTLFLQWRHTVLAPEFSWLVSDQRMRTVFGVCLLLGLGAAMGREGLSQLVDASSWATAIVTRVFGSEDGSARFAGFVVASWHFCLVVHILEACYTAYLCKTVLKIKTGPTLQWFVLNVATGLLAVNKVRELVAVDRVVRGKSR